MEAGKTGHSYFISFSAKTRDRRGEREGQGIQRTGGQTKDGRTAVKNVSPPGQTLHSRCRFSAEEFPEESVGHSQQGDGGQTSQWCVNLLYMRLLP